jgi:hypothetical protein
MRLTLDNIKFQYTATSEFFLGDDKIFIDLESGVGNEIPVKWLSEESSLVFESELDRLAFDVACDSGYLCKNIYDIFQKMEDWKQLRASNEQIISKVKKNVFFKQLENVKIEGSCKAKIYGNKIYMNGVEVSLNLDEIKVFEEILKEANWHFANYEDSDINKIANSLIIKKMFNLHFPNYESLPNKFSATVPYWFKQLFNYNA